MYSIRISIAVVCAASIASVCGVSQTSQPESSAQVTSSRSAAKATANVRTSSSKDSQREIAMRLLNEAEAEASALDSSGAAGLLYMLGQTYASFDKKKAADVLEAAYQNARVATEQNPVGIAFIMSDLIAATVRVSPAYVEQSLPPENGRDYALRLLIQDHLAHKQLHRALDLFRMMHSDSEMTDAAVPLMMALPSSRSDDNNRIFADVMRAYDASKHQQVGTGTPEDLGTLLVRFWPQLRPALVVEASDILLSQAKEMSQSVVMSTADRTITFSAYQFRVFQLLPALQKVDPDRASSLLKEVKEASSWSRDYPDGQRSVDPWLRDTPMKDGERPQTRYAYVDQQSSGTQAAEMQVDRTIEKISAQAQTDPNSALANAELVRDLQLRARVLLGISESCKRTNTTVAISALRKMLDVPPQNTALLNLSAADVAVQVGDIKLANRFIDQGLKYAHTVYEDDSDKDNPNTALKVSWPSMRAYRDLLCAQAKFSRADALQNLKEVPDAELRALEKVAVGATLLNVPLPSTSPLGKMTGLRK